MKCLPLSLFCLAAAAGVCIAAAPRGVPADKVAWKKTVVDSAFRSEGVAVADVDRDGKKDVMVGDYWYAAPNWTRSEIRPPRTDLGDGRGGYSDAFCCFAGDFNRDGWPDVMVVGFPGKETFWYENPKNQAGHWKQRLVSSSSCNETPIYAGLFGDGSRYLVMATQPEGRMWWFAPGKNPDDPWTRRPISAAPTENAKIPGTDVYAHGLGAGDVNRDGRMDVMVKEGWWEQPKNAKNADAAPWTFHPAPLGEDCANLHALDADGDKRSDVFSSSAHRNGLWWHQQKADGSWQTHTIRDDVSQTHALNVADVNNDGRPDLITGKRWWAHGPDGDVAPNAAPHLFWTEIKPRPNAAPEFVSHLIDDASGVGTQFVVEDINGDKRLDVVVSNKRGVFVFEQTGK